MKTPAKKTASASFRETAPAARPPAEPPIFRVSTEVLLKIFSFLDKRSCSRVARSCKRFKEPALDQLWREITTLAAPLALLDELINTYSGMMFRHGLGQVDWFKYWSYANRVRKVHITDKARALAEDGHVNPETLAHALAATTSQTGHGTLLPKARALEFDFHEYSGPSLVLPLIGPAVRHITIQIPQSSELMAQVISRVISTLTSMSNTLKLEQFDITICYDINRDTETRRTLSSNIAKFIASQPTLQCLRICPVDSFSPLKQAIQVLPRLRVLEITCTTNPHKPPPKDIIASLASCVNLEQLRINGPSPRGQHDFSLIQPLLSCNRLATLDLSWLGAVRLNAEDVEEMGKAWVKLESLHFSIVGDGMPVDLLLAFATSFSPSLHALSIPLDISRVGFLLLMATEIPPHDLKVLYTGSPMTESDVQPFAELLGTLFRPGFQVVFGIGQGRSTGTKEAASFYKK
ncbi:hypothetical protein FRC01_010166, partial [Tulasnella sp. 417]